MYHAAPEAKCHKATSNPVQETQHDMTKGKRAEGETSAKFVNLIDEHHGVASACGLETLHHLAGHCSHICPAMPCTHCPSPR